MAEQWSNNGWGDERRRHPRLPMPARHTELHIRREGGGRFTRSGPVRDISAGGVRFESPEPLQSGERVEVRVLLPEREGVPRRTIRASGQVMRLVGPDGADAAQMAMAFTEVRVPKHPQVLACYIQEAAARRPASTA